MTLFLRGGTPFQTQVPLGNYELRYAAGDTWYGETHLFGKNTKYAKASDTFNFTFDGNRYSGYTVELILQK